MSKKIEAKSLVDAATEQLEAAIISGELTPGKRLREQQLADEYGISRGPLREAIRRLEGRRLLERTANIGVRSSSSRQNASMICCAFVKRLRAWPVDWQRNAFP